MASLEDLAFKEPVLLHRIWSTLMGQSTRDAFPEGIALSAVVQRCGVPFYAELKRTRSTAALSSADRTLLRAYSYYQRVRASAVRSYVDQLVNYAPTGSEWFLWKGAALLSLMAGYSNLFEAADIDLEVALPSITQWLERLQAAGAHITKVRKRRGLLYSFQARHNLCTSHGEVTGVLDVHARKDVPELVCVRNVYVPQRETHLQMMKQHILKHHRHKGGCRLRMFYDAQLLGAEWSSGLCDRLLLNQEV